MKKLLVFVFAISAIICTQAHAQSCNKRMTTPTVSPASASYGAVATWLEWLNNGTYNCTSSFTDIVCTKSGSSEKYWLRMYGCDSSRWCSAHVDDIYGYRNGVSWQAAVDGSASTFNFDNGSHGTLQLVCTPNTNQLNQPCIWSYKACWQNW